MRGGSYRSAWNRHDGARGRQWTSEDGTISVKAPPAVAGTDQARGVRIQNAVRRCRTAMLGYGSGGLLGDLQFGEEGASKSDQPKRAPANGSVSPSQAQAARTALVPGEGSSLRTKVAVKPRESVHRGVRSRRRRALTGQRRQMPPRTRRLAPLRRRSGRPDRLRSFCRSPRIPPSMRSCRGQRGPRKILYLDHVSDIAAATPPSSGSGLGRSSSTPARS